MRLLYTWLGFFFVLMVLHILMTFCGRFGDLHEYGVGGYENDGFKAWAFFYGMELPTLILLLSHRFQPTKLAVIFGTCYQLMILLSVLCPTQTTYVQQVSTACVWLIPLNIATFLMVLLSPRYKVEAITGGA